MWLADAMTALLTCLLLAAVDVPDLQDRERFPPPSLVNAHIGVLIDARFTIKRRLALDTSNAGLRRRLMENGHQLRCWEELLAAHGALEEEEGGRGDEAFCRESLARLRRLIGEDAY